MQPKNLVEKRMLQWETSRAILMYIVVAVIAAVYIYIIQRTTFRTWTMTTRLITDDENYVRLTLSEMAYAIASIHRAADYLDTAAPEKFSDMFPRLKDVKLSPYV